MQREADTPVRWQVVRRVAAALAAAGLLALVFLFLWETMEILLLAFAAVLIAILLRTISNWINEWIAMPAPVALLLTFGLVACGLGAIGWWSAPEIIAQAQELRRQIPNALDQLRQLMARSEVGQEVLQYLRTGAGDPVARDVPGDLLMGAFLSAIEITAALILVPLLAVVLAANPQLYIQLFVRLWPRWQRRRIRTLIRKSGETLRWWLCGQVVAMVAVGVLSGLGLWFLNVPLAFLLGFIAGLLEFIPIIGPLMAAVPAILLGLMQSPMTALYVIVWFIIVQQAESHILIPLVQRQAVRLPPALTVAMLTLFGTLYGMIGLLLATPLAALGLVLAQNLHAEFKNHS